MWCILQFLNAHRNLLFFMLKYNPKKEKKQMNKKKITKPQ